MSAAIASTLRELVENEDFVRDGGLDLPLYVVDPQDEDDHAFPLQLAYDLTVTITHDGYDDVSKHRQVILLSAREDFDAVIVHD